MMTSAMADQGLSTHALDLEYSRKLNLLSGFGFIVAVASAFWMQKYSFYRHLVRTCQCKRPCSQIRRLVRHGLVWMAPPCSSWSFMPPGSIILLGA